MGIIVTTPKSETANAAQEAADCIRDGGGKRPPSRKMFPKAQRTPTREAPAETPPASAAPASSEQQRAPADTNEQPTAAAEAEASVARVPRVPMAGEGRENAGRPEMTGPIMLDEIAVDAAQHRTDETRAIAELAASMRHHGQQVPVRVCRSYAQGSDRQPYRLVYGHRRVAAARVLGWLSIDAEVFPELPDSVVQEMRAVENLQREDLDPVEEALAVAALVDSAGDGGTKGKDLWTVGRPALQAVADRLGKPLAWVEARTSVARLSPRVRALVADGRLPLAHAREVAKLADAESQEEAAAIALGCYQFPALDDRADGAVHVRPLAQVRQHVARRLATLRGVQWKLDVPFAGRPACEGCLDNSACSSLFDADRPEARCLNLACYRAKATAAEKAVAAAVKKAEPDAACAPTAAGVRRVAPEFVKPASVARRLAAARGLAPKGKAAAADKPKEIPWDQRPEQKHGRAHRAWKEKVFGAVIEALFADRIRLVRAILFGQTITFERHVQWSDMASRKVVDKVRPMLSRVLGVPLSSVASIEAVAADIDPKRFDLNWPLWLVRHAAGMLGVNLPPEPVLADFLPKAAKKPAAAKKAGKAKAGRKGKARKAEPPKRAKAETAAAQGNVRGGGDCAACNECEED